MGCFFKSSHCSWFNWLRYQALSTAATYWHSGAKPTETITWWMTCIWLWRIMEATVSFRQLSAYLEACCLSAAVGTGGRMNLHRACVAIPKLMEIDAFRHWDIAMPDVWELTVLVMFITSECDNRLRTNGRVQRLTQLMIIRVQRLSLMTTVTDRWQLISSHQLTDSVIHVFSSH